MQTNDLKNILDRISPFFIVKRIHKNGDDWTIIGRLLSDATEQDLNVSMKGSEFVLEVKQMVESLDLLFKKMDPPLVIKIPKVTRIHLFLFFSTILTTLFAGTLMAGGNPFSSLLEWEKGIPFSFALMLILGCHETGHYVYARKHKVDATLPYFIPAPTFIGTFGAFIKIKSPIYNRLALLEIGAAGPIAGFLVAVPALIWGLSNSIVIDTVTGPDGIKLGDSILMKLLIVSIFPGLTENQDVILHPVAFAGWIGLLVTMLNLLPIGQLDGGHIGYAMLGRKFDKVAKIAWLCLIPMSVFSPNWLIWALLIFFLMRTTKHPPLHNVDAPHTPREKWIGIICLLIFILCFIPAPFPS